MDFSFELRRKDKKTKARSGIIHTPHGDIHTPAFSPVATKATVKSLTPEELLNAKGQVVLGNSYHLYLRPGTKVLKEFGGFAPFMKWNGPTITDSGGYQVSFMWTKELVAGEHAAKVKITDEGAKFRSHIDGSLHLFTPKKSMEIQQILGADIIMAFDQPMSPRFTEKKNKEAFVRTLKWEEKSYQAWNENKMSSRKKYQALFGIIQGGTDKKLRKQCLDFILTTGFPGIAIGDESIGSDPKVTAMSLDTIAEYLPDDKPLHALGLGGGPEGIFEAVERGVDIFDNSSVTRIARTGLLFIHPEDGGNKVNKFRLDIKRTKFEAVKGPISKMCGCYTCKNYSTAYVHHLLINSEILGSRLATIHNVYFINNLMEKIKNAIENGDFVLLKKEWLM